MERRYVSRARRLRRQMADAERALWMRLRGRGLLGWKFRRQHGIGHCIADFACLDARLVIEVDGGQHVERCRKDALRTQRLEASGFRIIRFWNGAVLKNIEDVLEVIARELQGIAPHPNPHPEGAREKSEP
jgi:very-short-patch-repair endonuclease